MKMSKGRFMFDSAGSATPNSIADAAHPRKHAIVHSALRRLGFMDWLAIALLAAGLLFTATGLLPADAASAVVKRILPLLIFLGSVIVLAELTAWAGVFDVVATRIAMVARGSYPVLFVLCVAFATLVTATLNLDTTAVLLTPVMLA